MASPARLDAARIAPTTRRYAGRVAELRVLLALGDIGAAAAAAWLAPWLWSQVDRQFVPTAGLAIWESTFVVVWPSLLRVFGGGHLATPAMGRRSLQATLQSLVAATVLVFVLFYFAPFLAPRGSTLLTLPFAAALTLAWRFGFLRVHERVLPRRVAAVLGVDEAAHRAAAAMISNETSIFRVAGFLAGPAYDLGAQDLPAPVLRLEDDIWDVLRRLGADLLVVGHSRGVPQEILVELARCYEHGVEAVPATTIYEQLEGRVMASALEADWYAELPTASRGLYMILKRIVDIAFALVFGVLLLPIMVVIAVGIWRGSGRPIVLRQVRVGLRGAPFVMHKFRTMRADAEGDGEARWAAPADERVTPFGRLLRRTRLDELPQLWEVLRGAMSLIGPRPERPEFVEQLARQLPLYRARVLVSPGITGWAQVQYPYAGSLEENLAKLEYDLYYIRHVGPLLDARIALRTILTIFRRDGR